MKKIINKFKPDFIFHLAAQAIVSISKENPVETISSNTIGTMNLLEVLRSYKKKCSVADIVRLHTETDYLVYFIGFQPGFLYLGGLHQNLLVPRKSTPRVRVDKGSVGIGGAQTGVYPQNSSGGWNIIGKSPLNFFNMKATNPCFAKPGDRIQFVAVDIHTFYEIEREVIKQELIIKKRPL